MRGEVSIFLSVLKAPVNSESSLIILLNTTASLEGIVPLSQLHRNSRRRLLSQLSIWDEFCLWNQAVGNLK